MVSAESVKLSQVKMAEIVGVKQSSLNRYELNQASPTFETLYPVCGLLPMSPWTISLGAPTIPRESCTSTSPKNRAERSPDEEVRGYVL